MFCADDSEESNCHKIGLGKGVAGTILEMPQGLWSGALRRGQGNEAVKEAGYPRLVRGPRVVNPLVYDLTFDYDFRPGTSRHGNNPDVTRLQQHGGLLGQDCQ